MTCKTINHLAPPYLSLLVSCPGQQQYTPRTNQNIPLLFGTNYSYVNSLLPNTVKEWNKLPIAIRQSTTMNISKSKLSKLKCPTKPPDYYNTGSRQGQTYHARLHMQTSDLNDNLVKRRASPNRRAPPPQIFLSRRPT